ncbi:Crossover junction endonuclease [Wickerhamomyces ciferrii]|uniref:Crossover junction endonuclease MUS81 n=1 Tax=Wickerhamomyces ciferrii (strain ATCC 14091 / BCRC 22168 / CBS 111 / JCM 3599 / NBRC 0793 / NRRL Y-1031 F-60-10) TaxID=1206466 RepID=K0KL72_WICCF|nr:Crossover junction endonuclease [Wickerhamomyces ciferrii]CCH43736.1 Crossover junction endonuclease [Wickerhamomyces ciferrii]
MDLPNDIKHLYITWLEEDVLAYSLRNQKSALLYTRALEKLRNYNNPVLTPRELIRVPFIGEKIVGQMEKRLAKYCDENGYQLPVGINDTQRQAIKFKRSNQDTTNDDDNVSVEPCGPSSKKRKPAKPAKKKKYVPVKRSGGYAILLVLLERDPDCNGLTKNEIIQNASPYCDKSFTSNPGTNQFYSAWNSVKTLLNNDLVKVEGRPAHYYLTDEGKELAKNLKSGDDVEFGGAQQSSSSRSNTAPNGRSSAPNNLASDPPDNTFVQDVIPSVIPARNRTYHEWNGVRYHFWEPGSYSVRFVVDNREIRSVNERDFFDTKLQTLGVKAESRPLTVGDGIWIARNRNTNEEVVLDYIIERKRLDDLASSIKDGRYNEQKVRLKRSAVQNVFYLIEEVTSSDVQQMADAIQTAMSMAMTTSNFHVKRTKDADDTIQFIAKTTKQVRSFYQNKKLLVLEPRNLEYQQDYKRVLDEFREKFNTSNVLCSHMYYTFDTMLSKSKLMTTRELFVRMLMTIRGVSLEKAIAIQRDFKTPRHLFENFDAKDPELAKKYGKRIQELIGDLYKK